MNRVYFLYILLVLCGTVQAGTYYVSPDGSDTSPYDTWEKAATNISDVPFGASNDVVYVGDGTYELASKLYITNYVYIKGTNLPTVYCTLPGSIPVTVMNSYCENICFSNLSSWLDAVIVAGNSYFSNCVFKNKTSGTYQWVVASNSTVASCYVSNNAYTAASGGRYLFELRGTDVYDCQFNNNTSVACGVIRVSTHNKPTSVSNCVFNNNIITGTGGSSVRGSCVCADSAGAVNTIIDCDFIGNTTTSTNSGNYYSAAPVVFSIIAKGVEGTNRVIRCLFSNNYISIENSATIDIGAGSGSSNQWIDIDDCIFTHNTANSPNTRNAVMNIYSYTAGSNVNVRLTDCVFKNNYTKKYLIRFINYDDMRFYMENCLIVSNLCDRQIIRQDQIVYPEYHQIKNCTIANNVDSDTNTSDYIYFRGQYKNIIYWNNDFYWHSGVTNVNYSCIDSNIGKGTGNITNNPRFASSTDLHLKSLEGTYVDGEWVRFTTLSPCIDAGDPASEYINEPKPNGYRVNMGYYGNTAEASKSLNTNREPDEILIPNL
jgi:hypothetical protein